MYVKTYVTCLVKPQFVCMLILKLHFMTSFKTGVMSTFSEFLIVQNYT